MARRRAGALPPFYRYLPAEVQAEIVDFVNAKEPTSMTDTPARTPRDAYLDAMDELYGATCINCDRAQLPEESWPQLTVNVLQPSGELETLETWPVCPDCQTSQGATLVQYVKFALS